jgi:hypothetical protein
MKIQKYLNFSQNLVSEVNFLSPPCQSPPPHNRTDDRITESLSIFMMMLLLLLNEKKIRTKEEGKPHESAEITNFLFKFFSLISIFFQY